MSDVAFAAVWPARSRPVLEDVLYTRTSYLKHFHPKNAEDFRAGDLYKFKPPSAGCTSLVFVLKLGGSLEAVKESLINQRRVLFPNRKHVDYMQSSTEEESPSLLANRNLVKSKEASKGKMARNILHQYRNRKPYALVEKENYRSPAVSGGSEKKDGPTVYSISAQLQKLESEFKINKEEQASVVKSLEATSELSENRVHAVESELECEKAARIALEGELEKEKRERLEDKKRIKSLEKKVGDLEGRLKDLLERSSGETSIAANLPSSSAAEAPLLSPPEMLCIGRGVNVDKDMWQSVNTARTKDDWAFFALQAVFGEDAKYYRARKPRTLDPKLRVFPQNPPVLAVLKHYYRKWLDSHVEVLDCRPKGMYLELPDESARELKWEEVLDRETEVERQSRRRETREHLLGKLGSVLGDKAMNLYRQGKRLKRSPVAANERSPAVMAASNQSEANEGCLIWDDDHIIPSEKTPDKNYHETTSSSDDDDLSPMSKAVIVQQRERRNALLLSAREGCIRENEDSGSETQFMPE